MATLITTKYAQDLIDLALTDTVTALPTAGNVQGGCVYYVLNNTLYPHDLYGNINITGLNFTPEKNRATIISNCPCVFDALMTNNTVPKIVIPTTTAYKEPYTKTSKHEKYYIYDIKYINGTSGLNGIKSNYLINSNTFYGDIGKIFNAELPVNPKGENTLSLDTPEQVALLFDEPISTASDIPEFVDLGLSVKWATCNVDAANPWEEGALFSWGDPTPHYREEDSNNIELNDFKPADYIFGRYDNIDSEEHDSFFKYCQKQHNLSFVDNRTELEPSNDPATVNKGKDWRVPTHTEIEELLSQTTRTYVTENDVKCIKFTSKLNSNYIIIPINKFDRFGNTNNETIVFLSRDLMEGTNYPYSYEVTGDEDDDDEINVDKCVWSRSAGRTYRAVCELTPS